MIVELQDISKIIMGQSPKGESYNDSGQGLPLLNGAADYKGNSFNPKNYTSSPTRVATKGDILLGIRATIGNFAFADQEYCIGRGVAAIRVDENKADKAFILKYVERELEKIIHRAAGSTIKGIKKEDLTEMKVILPPLPIQKKIAAILDAADAYRQKTKTLIAKYDELSQSLFLEMFGDPVKNEKGWPIRPMEELVQKITDGEHQNPSLVEHGKHLIMAKNVLHDSISFDEPKYVSKEDFEKYIKKCNPEYGDVLLVSRGATVGRCTVVKTDIRFCLMGSVILIKASDKLSGEFISQIFKHSNFSKKLVAVSSASAQQAIYITHLKKLKVPVPPIEFQNKFAERVQAIETQKAQAQASLDKAEDLFASLLQRAFKGELV